MADITDAQLTTIRAKCIKAAVATFEPRHNATENILLRADQYFEWIMEPVTDDT